MVMQRRSSAAHVLTWAGWAGVAVTVASASWALAVADGGGVALALPLLVATATVALLAAGVLLSSTPAIPRGLGYPRRWLVGAVIYGVAFVGLGLLAVALVAPALLHAIPMSAAAAGYWLGWLAFLSPLLLGAAVLVGFGRQLLRPPSEDG